VNRHRRLTTVLTTRRVSQIGRALPLRNMVCFFTHSVASARGETWSWRTSEERVQRWLDRSLEPAEPRARLQKPMCVTPRARDQAGSALRQAPPHDAPRPWASPKRTRGLIAGAWRPLNLSSR
jgi:hypothetical protein